MTSAEEVPLWLGVELIASVVALEDGRLRALANVSGGHFTEVALEDRLRALGARPTSREGGEVRYQVVTEAGDRVVAVAAAEAEPRDLGLLMHFTLDRDMELWDTQVLEVDWADALFGRTAAPVQSITRSDRGT